MSREASVGGSGEASSNSGVAIPSVASTTSGTSDSKRLAVNAPGNRSDPGWKHGIAVDENPKKVQCKYCQKVINGGIYRLKHHLAGTQKDVGACKAVSDDVRKEMWKIISSLQENLIKRAKEIERRSSDSSPLGQYEDEEVEGAKRQRREIAKNPGDLFKKRGVSSQTTINGIFKKNLREEACQGIAFFFYNNAIPFHVAKSDEFKKMLDLVARHGIGFKPPSYHEIRVKYLKQQVDCTKEVIEQHKAFWKKMGCTIMTDGWTDKRRRTILNFLVNSPMGTIFLKSIDASDISKTADKIFKLMDEIVEEVGEENVVQIVTDNAANYKAAGEMLMGKRKRLYWTPCAAHCIDLMLEDFEKKIPIHKETIARGKKITTYIYSRTALISLLHHFTKEKDLIRPATTRFATSYLTLGCLNDNKGALIRMFTSKEWKSSQFAKTKDGKVIENVVMDKDFWKSIITCLRSAYPLIKVLRLVDSDEKPAMGFIYEEMDRAKEKIQAAFNGIKKSYLPLWEIIDARWDNQLHRPLHAAGYYLNPQFHYSPNFKADFEVKRGIYDCLQRMVESMEEVKKIDAQLEDFKYRKKFFGSAVATCGIETKTPAQWWESYGYEHPELQKFAIRVLSLTCSSSGCERNWSAFEMVHTKRRNRLKAKTMNDVVFVMANSKLAKKKELRKVNDYSIDDLASDDDWIVDDSENLDLDASNEDLVPVEEGPSSGAPHDDLELPSYDDDEVEEGGDAMEDAGDEEHMEDDYEFMNL
ncbi:uncharacterized protein LOC122034629 [Zingiber officinale]|uniref:uncharacterized protein LOC122034629 n=1 Tax=Zingiber officinale TaxID=94328 RepID=UPI001C4C1719|nr:uncharacterized protein LOC122034629 [Zingiber officinale]